MPKGTSAGRDILKAQVPVPLPLFAEGKGAGACWRGRKRRVKEVRG